MGIWVNGCIDIYYTAVYYKDYKQYPFKYKFIKIYHENTAACMLIAYSVISYSIVWELDSEDSVCINNIIYHAHVILGLYFLLYFGTCYHLIEYISILSIQLVRYPGQDCSDSC